MPFDQSDETTIGVTAFKAQCLGLIDDVVQGKTSRIILTRHDRPVAVVMPMPAQEENLNTLDGLWGAMEGMMTVAPGVDIMEPTGEVWRAESDDNFFDPS